MIKIIKLRFTKSFQIENPEKFKLQMLHWSQQFREVVFLDSNIAHNTNQKYKSLDCILAVEAFTSIKTDYINAFEDLKQYQQTTKDWLFGYLSYDLKNDIEDLTSENYDGLNFPDLYFLQPKKIFLLKNNILEIQYLHLCDDEADADYDEICATAVIVNHSASKIDIQERISNENYINKVSKILEHIQHGDIYEANFCMEFYAKNADINSLEIFNKLNKISSAPFSVFFKNNKQYLLSASPERFLKKENSLLISQPIKGTAKRFTDQKQDLQSKTDLENNEKERSENIMITDLVRNDLSKTATKGSVYVEELCQIYSYKQVHQMVSTIVSNVENHVAAVDIIKSMFPMGSMTGAPKVSAMQIIENLEETKRGLYSGAVGYFTPENDFDFNVVIRSILYNEEIKYLSFSVGSAITAASIPETEYHECMLKAKAMFEVLNT